MSIFEPEDARRIGFNTGVICGGHSLHVQTEVVGRAELFVRTTILAGGTVLRVERQPLPHLFEGETDARSLVEAIHEQIVNRVRRGEIE